MARYGRDYGQDRWNAGGGYGGNWGGGRSRGGEYGGMGSDASFGGGSQAYGGRSGFGTGGGAYDNDFGTGYRGGYGGYGYGGPGYTGGGYGGGSWGASGGYGETGFSGGGYGGAESDWGGGRDLHRGGYGYGGGTGGYGGYGYGGGSDRGTGGWSRSGGTQGDELRRTRAADVMTENPECVTPDTSLAEAARKMRDLDVGIIPVVDSANSRRLRGVLTDRDITIRAVAEGKDAQQCRVSEVMTTEVETCNKNDTLRDVLGVMEREQVRRVPITDREGRLVGIIAQADVLTDVDSHPGQHRVTETLESISEPGHRGGGGRASQSRGMSGGTGWQASGRGGEAGNG